MDCPDGSTRERPWGVPGCQQLQRAYAAALSDGLGRSSSSHASRVHHACSSPHSGHFTWESTSGRSAKLSGSISMPVKTALPVCGQLIRNVAMRPLGAK